MRISVITVCFNAEDTIGETIRSVRDQTHREIEHIIIDGASTDRTMTVVEALRSPRMRMLSEPDAGIYDAMNKGLALATGDFVGFLNADDLFASPHAAACIAAAAGGQPSVQAVYGDLSYVSKTQPFRVLRYWRSGTFDVSRLRWGWMPPHPTFYVARTALQRLGGFNPRYRIAGDYDFMLRLLASPGATVSYVPKVLVHMRAGGVSNRSLPSIWQKSREDLLALKGNRIGGWSALFFKNARKASQFIRRPETGLDRNSPTDEQH